MNPVVYNATVGVGVVLASVGAGAQFGWPVGLIVAGAMLIGLSVYTLRVLVR
jgi:hypothetical protein